MIDLKRFKAKTILRDEKIKTEKKAAKRDQRFAGVFLKEAAAACCKATKSHQAFVWIWLQYLAWEARYKPFKVSNERLKAYGIGRATKERALTAFEKAGLISVVQIGKNSPVVTVLVPIKRFKCND